MYGSFKATSEFDLKISVCFVENGSLSSKMGVCFGKWQGRSDQIRTCVPQKSKKYIYILFHSFLYLTCLFIYRFFAF